MNTIPTVITPTLSVSFDQVDLGNPVSVSGGMYFMKLYNDSAPMYVHIPAVTTKQGIRKNTADLVFTGSDPLFINWIEQLEERCQKIILSRSADLFQTPLSAEDLEACFTSSFKIYKSGKYYSMRVAIASGVPIADMDGGQLPHDQLMADHHISGVLEVGGVKFSSKSFCLEYHLRQVSVVPENPFVLTVKPSVSQPKQPDVQTKQPDVQTKQPDVQTKHLEPQPKHLEPQTNNISEMQFEDEELVDLDTIEFVPEVEEFVPEVEEFVSDAVEEFAPEDTIALKSPTEIHRRIYGDALAKAKEYQLLAEKAFADADKIKRMYNIE